LRISALARLKATTEDERNELIKEKKMSVSIKRMIGDYLVDYKCCVLEAVNDCTLLLAFLDSHFLNASFFLQFSGTYYI